MSFFLLLTKLVKYIYDDMYIIITHNYFTKIRAIIKLHVDYDSIDVYLNE